MDILKDIQETSLELNPSFYKYCVQIIDWDEVLVKKSLMRLQASPKTNEDHLQPPSLLSDVVTYPYGNTMYVPAEEENGKHITRPCEIGQCLVVQQPPKFPKMSHDLAKLLPVICS